MAEYVVGISGASGIILGIKTAKWLIEENHIVHLVISSAAKHTASLEIDENFSSTEAFIKYINPQKTPNLKLWSNHDFTASIASGSFRVQGCAIVPCSMATLSAISMGLSDNLIRRSADVAMKEKWKLVIVPRETPFNDIHLENMKRLSNCGAVIVPPVPAWYLKPKTIDEVEDVIVSRVIDSLGVEIKNKKVNRWV